MKFKYLAFILSTSLLASCKTEWSYQLYCQKIEDSPKVIYNYIATGGRDTMIHGFVIMDSSDVFEVDLSKNLDVMYLEEIPNRKFILGIGLEPFEEAREKEIFDPIEKFNISQEGIDIKVKKYQNAGFQNKSISNGIYKFERFVETRDSVCFYNLDEPFINPQHLESLKLKKGNLFLRQNKEMEIIEIQIEDIQISKSDRIYSHKSYLLKPKGKISVLEFSDYGIFKMAN
ncbi:hypothetical protein [Flavobacterium silvaticum]|uniref:Lipoprotein n=1 Tax=Flavobacterium silvaticum TaxID=1852020 RepID=A0A972JED0_9FLAO|nr:hypothetical protein [Flavobacterium silvaticum]NMH26744.1 hypothetical protein [Flavobacterium silvaticum]